MPYNEAAAEIVGSPFEEIGTMPREEWNARYGPFDEQGPRWPPTNSRSRWRCARADPRTLGFESAATAA